MVGSVGYRLAHFAKRQVSRCLETTLTDLNGLRPAWDEVPQWHFSC
jgi:hypothetical protein